VIRAECIEYGASITSLNIPMREGARELVLGCESVADYEAQEAYLGAVVGRCANRIYRGLLNVEGEEHQLSLNHGEHHLHGGDEGLSQQVWSGEIRDDERGPSVRFTYVSPAGQAGYPGQVRIHVDYTLDREGALWLDYAAESDVLTALNLTQHAYFNLGREHSRGCGQHRVLVRAERYLETDANRCPTGRIHSVKGSPLDLRNWTLMARALDSHEPLLRDASGFDHTLLLHAGEGRFQEVAYVESPEADLRMVMSTDQASLQFYTGNFLEGTPARRGMTYRNHDGFCLEAQGLPDATRHPAFPSSLLRPGASYRQRTCYRFERMGEG